MDNRHQVAEDLAAQIAEPREWVALLRSFDQRNDIRLLNEYTRRYAERRMNEPAIPEIPETRVGGISKRPYAYIKHITNKLKRKFWQMMD